MVRRAFLGDSIYENVIRVKTRAISEKYLTRSFASNICSYRLSCKAPVSAFVSFEREAKEMEQYRNAYI